MDTNLDINSFSKRMAALPEKPKGWLAEKWGDFTFWCWLNQPDWWRTANRFYWNHIRCIAIPQNRWATRAVPRTWSDKVSLIPDLLYAAIIDFVEREKCFEVTDWNDTEETLRLAAELREVYEWAKTGRAAFAERVEASVQIDPKTDLFCQNVNWDEYNRLTDEMEQWDTRCLEWIVRWRGILWT